MAAHEELPTVPVSVTVHAPTVVVDIERTFKRIEEDIVFFCRAAERSGV